ncbi:RluA family pseudouridine synthase [Sulfurovum sp. XGS-02]|uniref:RluA family pseudouridine synthase n=1 Tax=Sulfurovum sp. XGS-02 TaxID=2925411 RepID=UPI0020527133|nr:RluA family pseudouridine synthase [Sulfurovum sp. XGS-02]UPT78562.1 RluA family pseudouridine synthase [Sulfurovum sp. XGS-02]
MAEKFIVKERSTLLDFLINHLTGWSKKTVKQRLQGSSIAVNGEISTKYDFPLNVNDVVEVGVVKKASTQGQTLHKLEIIYQDKDIIAINKPAGLLSVGNTTESKQHALAILRNQLSRAKKQVKLWPVHRLDRDTSGILLFATSKEMRESVMDKWSIAEKIYLAIVEGYPKEKKGTITQPLRADEREYRMHIGKHPDAKAAVTHYTVKQTTPERALLEVKIETGRQHQIRAHLAWLGHSILGDERYGTKGEKMGLHAKKLTIIHPVNKKPLSFEVDAPRDFYALLN